MPTIHKLSLTDPVYAELAKAASRVVELLPKIHENPAALACVDDLLGAIYALDFARWKQYQDRVGQPIEVEVLQTRAAQLSCGKIRTDGKWTAGFHFNGALFRLAAVYNRFLRISGDGKKTGVTARVHLGKVQFEVNELKHGHHGLYKTRAVTYEDALAALRELLDLF